MRAETRGVSITAHLMGREEVFNLGVFKVTTIRVMGTMLIRILRYSDETMRIDRVPGVSTRLKVSRDIPIAPLAAYLLVLIDQEPPEVGMVAELMRYT